MKITYKVEENPSLCGPDGWNIFKTEECPCCGVLTTKRIAKFMDKSAAEEYAKGLRV